MRFEDFEKNIADKRSKEQNLKLNIAQLVTEARIKRGFTQEELAKLVGKHQSSIARLERGKHYPSIPILDHIFKALGFKLGVHLVEEKKLISSSDVEPFSASETYQYPKFICKIKAQSQSKEYNLN